jgi:hypothetical protein
VKGPLSICGTLPQDFREKRRDFLHLDADSRAPSRTIFRLSELCTSRILPALFIVTQGGKRICPGRQVYSCVRPDMFIFPVTGDVVQAGSFGGLPTKNIAGLKEPGLKGEDASR